MDWTLVLADDAEKGAACRWPRKAMKERNAPAALRLSGCPTGLHGPLGPAPESRGDAATAAGAIGPLRLQRKLRDLTRQRAQLVGERTRVANRIYKTLEDANVKLGRWPRTPSAKSGRAILDILPAGERDSAKLAQLARGALRRKIPLLTQALKGYWREHHTFLLQQLLKQLQHMEEQITAFSDRIEVCLRPFVNAEKMDRLDAIPGVTRRTVENVVAEIGADLSRFPTADHLSSLAGIFPGNEESAGKRIRNRTTKGNRWLRRALTEAAWAASHAKVSYFQAQYRRLAARRGKQRALVAVGHTLLIVFYHMLRAPVPYQVLGQRILTV